LWWVTLSHLAHPHASLLLLLLVRSLLLMLLVVKIQPIECRHPVEAPHAPKTLRCWRHLRADDNNSSGNA
jgi:hypothetical protein